MRAFLAALCAFLLTASPVSSQSLGASIAPAIPVASYTAPAPAVADGDTQLIFSVGPFTPNNVDTQATQGPGYLFYMQTCFNSNIVPDPTHTYVAPDGTFVVGDAGSLAGGHNVSSVTCTGSSACPTCWHGTAFNGNYAMEYRASYALSSIGIGSGGWPAMWVTALESRTASAQWPGQATGYLHFAEFDDPFEYFNTGFSAAINTMAVTMHDHSGISGATDTVFANTWTFPSGFDPGVYHTYLMLHHVATGTTSGTCGHTDLYVDGMFIFTMWAWSQYSTSDGPPPTTPQCPTGYTTADAVGDVQHQMIMLTGSDNNQLHVQSIRVWAPNKSGMVTN